MVRNGKNLVSEATKCADKLNVMYKRKRESRMAQNFFAWASGQMMRTINEIGKNASSNLGEDLLVRSGILSEHVKFEIPIHIQSAGEWFRL